MLYAKWIWFSIILISKESANYKCSKYKDGKVESTWKEYYDDERLKKTKNMEKQMDFLNLIMIKVKDELIDIDLEGEKLYFEVYIIKILTFF